MDKRVTINVSEKYLIIFSLFGIIGLISSFIVFCYWQNLYITLIPAFVTSLILVVITTLLILQVRLTLVLLVVLITTQTFIAIIWGAAVPYIELLPLIVGYLITNTSKKEIVIYYFSFTIFLTFIELFGIIPILNTNEYEIGTANLLIILSLQSICFVIFYNLLRIAKLFDEFNYKGLENVLINSPRNFILGSIIKGLYFSLLMHFFNNFLQKIVWGTKLDEKQNHTIRLFSESSRNDNNKSYELGNILKILELEDNNKNSHLIDVQNAKILYIILYNIVLNYKREPSDFSFSIESKQDFFTFIFSQNLTNEKKVNWGRNLGSIKQFLQLSNKGSIQISTKDHIYVTKLTITL